MKETHYLAAFVAVVVLLIMSLVAFIKFESNNCPRTKIREIIEKTNECKKEDKLFFHYYDCAEYALVETCPR
jgi:quinol-cytochrome oxidoreductase complex cytochrome b subunit